MLGVFAGVAIGLGLLTLPFGTLTLIALGLLAGALAGIPLRVGQRPNIQAAISALFLIGLGRSGAAQAGVARIWETAIGAGVSVLVAAFVWPPDPVRELRQRVARLRQELGADLAAVVDDLATGSGAAGRRLGDLRAHSLDAVRDVFELDRARGALRWNPLRRRDAGRFALLEARITVAARLYRHARSVARDVADAGPELRGAAEGRALAGAARALAEAADLHLRGEGAHAAAERARALLAGTPAAGGALVVATQLGQMLADLTRMSESPR